MYFISNHYGKTSQQNTMIVGGPLLNEIKSLPSVQNLIQKGATQLFSDGKFTAGESFKDKYRMVVFYIACHSCRHASKEK